MDVLNTLIKNSSLNGMPIWYKAVALFLFSAIFTLLMTMLVLLFINGADANIRI